MRLIGILFLFLISASIGQPIETSPPGASIFVNGKKIGKADGDLTIGEIDWDGEVLAVLDGYKAVLLSSNDVKTKVSLVGHDHTTSTGLPMASVPIVDREGMMIYEVQFAIWETRIRDYEEFAKSVQNSPELFDSKVVRAETHQSYESYYGVHGDKKNVSEDFPVAYTSRETEMAFCDWLTKRDRSRGLIGNDLVYRLPSDLEWSAAALVEESRDPDLSPNKREDTAKIAPYYSSKTYPSYPLGNLKGSESIGNEIADIGSLDVSDGFVGASPVGQFSPNRLGIFDLLGNLYEECLDLHYDDPELKSRMLKDSYITRGPGYDRFDPNTAVRYCWGGKECGFRIILAPTDHVPFGYHGERPTRSYTELVEKAGAVQSAATPGSKSEGNEQSKPESEGRSR